MKRENESSKNQEDNWFGFFDTYDFQSVENSNLFEIDPFFEFDDNNFFNGPIIKPPILQNKKLNKKYI